MIAVAPGFVRTGCIVRRCARAVASSLALYGSRAVPARRTGTLSAAVVCVPRRPIIIGLK
jgi:hypothetical protein